jgi:hypothetical protein
MDLHHQHHACICDLDDGCAALGGGAFEDDAPFGVEGYWAAVVRRGWMEKRFSIRCGGGKEPWKEITGNVNGEHGRARRTDAKYILVKWDGGLAALGVWDLEDKDLGLDGNEMQMGRV